MLFLSLQGPLVHLLGLGHLALILIEVAQVVDGVECGCMLRAPYFLVGNLPGLTENFVEELVEVSCTMVI